MSAVRLPCSQFYSAFQACPALIPCRALIPSSVCFTVYAMRVYAMRECHELTVVEAFKLELSRCRRGGSRKMSPRCPNIRVNSSWKAVAPVQHTFAELCFAMASASGCIASSTSFGRASTSSSEPGGMEAPLNKLDFRAGCRRGTWEGAARTCQRLKAEASASA